MHDVREPGLKNDGEEARAAEGSPSTDRPYNSANQSLEEDGTAATPAHNPGGGPLEPPLDDEPG